MTTYTATFADGTTITRNSDRAYGAAWRATWTNKEGNLMSDTGFSISPDKANAYAPKVYGVHGTPKQKAEAKRLNAEHLQNCGYRIEIVPAKIA